jgi:capsular polysaccharide biosynthesis protein
MSIQLFKNLDSYFILHDKDDTLKDIGYATSNNCSLIGRNLYYPNVLLYNENNIISPYDEQIMSLKKSTFYDSYTATDVEINNFKNSTMETTPVFFFIYHFDNYYHFLYDTLPYLYVYFMLKQSIPELRILTVYPNINKTDFYRFNIEILDILVGMKNILVHTNTNKNIIYETMYVSSSLTHGGASNYPPRKEIFTIYNKLIKNTIEKPLIQSCPTHLYISRRTWVHGDTSNIGTNYTTRRKMMNEDELVTRLQDKGFTEIFTEQLSTYDKINLFSRAKYIIGSIGGGMANLLFSTKNTTSIIIVTPYFLEINKRFMYSMEGSNTIYFYNVTTYKESNTIPLYCRVTMNSGTLYENIIGEIIGYNNGIYTIQLSNNDIPGFHNDNKYKTYQCTDTEFTLLDNGLNSPYIVDIELLLHIIQSNMEL